MHVRSSRKLGPEPKSSEITPEHDFHNSGQTRRRFLSGAAAGVAAAAGSALVHDLPDFFYPRAVQAASSALQAVPSKYTVSDPQTPQSKATTYNNFYEFGSDKAEPQINARGLHTRPWTIKITGMVKKPQTVSIDDLIAYRPLESRVYHFRCVEAWSMVIPWDGYSLSEFIKFCDPLSSAKYVQFTSFFDQHEMPEAASGYNWPYTEGLRMDEAMNPLTLLTFGAYGNSLANQNGAPVRIIIPWKYGFKSGKSIVRIHFTDTQPNTTWNDAGSSEYGFYANVNPNVDHPRWSQARERRIDASAFPHSVPTQMFNGYADQVASLYTGMDLRKNY